MTKKMESIINKYKGKLETTVFLFEMDYITFDECKTKLNEELERFEEMISSCFSYGLISKNDYRETAITPGKLYFEFFEKVVDIYYKEKCTEEDLNKDLVELEDLEKETEETEEEIEVIKILKEKLEFLESHNKNYTKQQYYTILEMLELLKEMEI